MTFQEHLARYETWLRTLDDAPSWSKARVVNSKAVHRPPDPAKVSREHILTPDQFADVFESYLDGRWAWIHLTCLGVIDDTLFVTFFVSSGGPADEPYVPRDRVCVVFSGTAVGKGWDAQKYFAIV